MLHLEFDELGEVRSLPQCVSDSRSAGPQRFLWASTRLGHVWCLKALKVGQDCRIWVGGWGPVLHGHSSEWEIFNLWRWERSWLCPVLSLKIVTGAALSSWWMLSSSVPMSRWLELLCLAGGCYPLLSQCLYDLSCSVQLVDAVLLCPNV